MTQRPEYNKISDELKKELGWDKTLKPNESVTFRNLGNPKHTRDTQGNKVEIFRASVNIPPTDIIYDPYKDNGPGMEPGGNVEIGVPKSWDSKNNQWTFEQIEFTKIGDNKLTFSGREPHKKYIIDYLRACNYNRTNPHSTPPGGSGHIFEEVKDQEIASKRVNIEKELHNAKGIIFGMSAPELATQLSVLKKPVKATKQENEIQLIDFITDNKNNYANLKKFLGGAVDTRTPIIHSINKAVELEIIAYEENSHVWNFPLTRKIIKQVPPGADPYDDLMKYFFESTIGRGQLAYVDNMIEKHGIEQYLTPAETKKIIGSKQTTKGKAATKLEEVANDSKEE